ncbi:MAG: hypothetical protein ACI39F_05470 [Acutalibacteraceae bacterium]
MDMYERIGDGMTKNTNYIIGNACATIDDYTVIVLAVSDALIAGFEKPYYINYFD